MILKYKVPENQRFRYNDKKIIYCEIKKELDLKMSGKKVYLVSMLNYGNKTSIFTSKELKRLNLFDKFKLWKKDNFISYVFIMPIIFKIKKGKR